MSILWTPGHFPRRMLVEFQKPLQWKLFVFERALLVLQDFHNCFGILFSIEKKWIDLCPLETFKVIKILYKQSCGLEASQLK